MSLHSNISCSKRRAARFAALQMCYTFCVNPLTMNCCFSDSFLSFSRCFSIGNIDNELSHSLTEGVRCCSSDLDSIISLALDSSWSLDRVDLIVLSVLRVALVELAIFDTPPQVIISEYVDLTSASLSSIEADFVNAVLDRLTKSRIEWGEGLKNKLYSMIN